MLARFTARIEAGLEKLRARCSRQRCDPGVIHRSVGRLRRNTRVAGLFDVRVGARPDGAAELRWRKRPQRALWARHSHGCYVLRSNVADWTPEDLWRAYMQLTQAEAAFRMHKSDVRLRPVWHQTAERRIMRMRWVVRPERAQSILLDRLGLRLPKRLRLPRGLAKCSANFF